MFQFKVGIYLIIIIIGIASSTDQYSNSTSTNCITFVEHTAFLSLNTKWNHYSVKSGFLVNITCSTNRISVYKKLCYWIDATMWLNINNSSEYLIKSPLFPVEDQLYRVDIHKTKSILNSDLQNVITPGVYNITAEGLCSMNFKGCFSVFPYVNNKNHKKQVFISHDRKNGVAWIFPLWYNQTAKANFIITVEHDKDYKTISHMTSHIVSKNGRIITKFRTTPKLPIYLVSVAVVQDFTVIYDENSLSSRRTSLWCRQEIRKNMTYIIYILDKVTHKLDCARLDKYRRCLPLSKIRPDNNGWNLPSVQYVVVPNYEHRIITTPGLVFLRELDITYDEQVLLPMQKIQVKLTAANYVIHSKFVEYFGINQLVHNWLFDMYMKYFAFTVLHKIGYNRSDPVESALSMDTYIVQSQWNLPYIEALNVNLLPDKISNSFFSSLRNITVFRGLRMIDMLRMESPGYVLDYCLKRLQNTTWTDDLLPDIVHRLDRWITQEYFELVVHSNHSGFAELKIVNYVSHTVNRCYQSFLKVKYTFGSSLSQSSNMWADCTKPVLIKDIPPNDYLIVNVYQTGFFRVNYNLENWKRLGRYLNSSNTLRDPVTCAQILDDAFYFLVRNARDSIDVDLFFDLASNLQRERDYALWYPMMNAVEYLSRYFPLEKYISNNVLRILNGFLTTTLYTKEISLMENNTFGYNLEYDVLKWACILKDLNCQEYIKAVMKWHIEDPTKNKLMPGWQKWLYCQGLQIEDVNYESSQIWHLLYRENDSLTAKQLEYLTCSTNEKNIIHSLCLVREQISIMLSHSKGNTSSHRNIELQVKKKFNDFFFLLAKHSNTNNVLELALNYMITIKAGVYKPENTLAILTVMINNIYSPESRGLVSFPNATKQFVKNMDRFINSIFHDKIDLNTKYKKNLIIDALIKKINNRFLFKWKDDWMKNRKT